LLVATVNFVRTHAFSASPTETGPGNPELGLTKKARLVIQHVGANDPLKEGFISGKTTAMPAQLAQWGTIVLAASQDPPTWRIANPVIGACPYLYKLSAADTAEAEDKGWRMTVTTQMLKVLNGDAVIHANFDTGYLRYDLNVIPAYPQHLEDPWLKPRLNTFIRNDGTMVSGLDGANENPIDRDRSHKYVITYDPTTGYAAVFVDDELRMNVMYAGHHDFTNGYPRFMFGTSGAEATFDLVQFQIFQ
jgi:hypothetical protein